MKIESPEDILREQSELESNMKYVKKMFSDAYKEQIAEIKSLSKIYKRFLNSKEPTTTGDIALALIGMNKQIMGLYSSIHTSNFLHLKTMEKALDSVIAINTIISVLKDISIESKSKKIQTKLRKLERTTKGLVEFNDSIIESIKVKKEELKKQQETQKPKPIPDGMFG